MPLAVFLAAGCDANSIIGLDDDLIPQDVEARYEWVEEGWNGSEPVGHPSVVLTWSLPDDWDGEVFRVYSRESDRAGYVLAATVTSCASESCRYTDLNVFSGTSYDYYVTSFDERTESESEESEARRIAVPVSTRPAAPTGPSARALDAAVWIRWTSTGAERYRVFLKREGANAVFIEVGETDGTSLVDFRAQNGQQYGYQIAAVDDNGHVSDQSVLVTATPRPDYHSELIYSSSDSIAASGFRFVTAETQNPLVNGGSASAQWRLEESAGVLRIVPLGTTRVSPGQFTTALTCGPGSDADCTSVDSAAGAAFGSSPVVVDAGRTYLFEVTGGDNQRHFAKIRVQGRSVDSAARDLVVFDWAYQLLANEPALVRQ